MLNHKVTLHNVNTSMWCAVSKIMISGTIFFGQQTFRSICSTHAYLVPHQTLTCVICNCRKCYMIKHLQRNLYFSLLYASFSCNYHSFCLVLKKYPNKSCIFKLETTFLEVFFNCIIHFEFLLLTHNISAMCFWEKNSQITVMLLVCQAVIPCPYW